MSGKDQSWSGRSPDLTAKQRSRADVSSGAARLGQAQRLASNGSSSTALDTVGSAPLPPSHCPTSTGSRRLLTARNVAETLGVCTETVLRWIRNGDLPAIRLPGGAIRIGEDELERWLDERATSRRGSVSHPGGRRPPGTLSIVSRP